MERATNFLSKDQEKEVVAAIRRAEKQTSGEIKVFIDNYSFERPKKTAKRIFREVGLGKTKQKNGILLLVILQTKKFVIWGDSGINAMVPTHYWEGIKNQVIKDFKHKKYTEGLVEAIDKVGEKLKQYFPYEKDDTNEISDEIQYNR